jgi:hypothetical protein
MNGSDTSGARVSLVGFIGLYYTQIHNSSSIGKNKIVARVWVLP